jgi:transposase
MGAPIEQDLAARQWLPATHVVDSGSVVADLLVNAPREHQIEVVGPLKPSSSRQEREGQGYDVHAFQIDWAAQQAQCLQGHRSVKWTPGHSPEGHAVIRIRFAKATCATCAVRQACTSSAKYPRQITVKPQAHHEAIRAAHARQVTPEFKQRHALRAGVESTRSQGARRFDLRRCRYIGLARTHMQQTINATAMHVVRVAHWLWGKPVGEHKRKAGHFARLAPASIVTESLASG